MSNYQRVSGKHILPSLKADFGDLTRAWRGGGPVKGTNEFDGWDIN